jgi:hypothetical protein
MPYYPLCMRYVYYLPHTTQTGGLGRQRDLSLGLFDPCVGSLRGTGRTPISTTPFSSDFFLSAAAAISLRLAAVSGAFGGVTSVCSRMKSSADLFGLGILSEVPALGLGPMSVSPSEESRSLSPSLGGVDVLTGLKRDCTEEEEEGAVPVPVFPDTSLAPVGVVLCLLSVCVGEAVGTSSLLRASTAFFPISSLLSLLSLLSRPFSRSDGEGK